MRKQFDGPEYYELDSIDREIEALTKQRNSMIQKLSGKPLDPKDDALINLAYEAGEMKVLAQRESKRADLAEKKLQDAGVALEQERGRVISNRNDATAWRERAEKAEAKLEHLTKKKVVKKKGTKK